MDPATTLEHGREQGGGAPHTVGPFLFRIASADDLVQPPARYSIAPFQSIAVGRAATFSADRRGNALHIGLGDPFASSRHAHLDRRDGAWRLRDEGSRNGTLVNGKRIPAGEQVHLREGDLLEIGHTFFLFRAAARGIAGGNLEPIAGGSDPSTLQPEWEFELSKAARLACTAHEVLIQGESGVGKEVLAQLLHQKSARPGPLVTVNCAALPESLFEDELFGHVRGAFSGAHAERQGLIRAANGGTLFLDEVAEMPLVLQAKLLRVLEDHQVRPLGAEKEIPVDVRVIAASHRDLDGLVAQGAFRHDLLARLGLLSLRVPALRERREDLGLLIRAVLRGGRLPLERVRFDRDALRLVLRYPWPLNVRELRRALLAATDLAAAGEGGVVTLYPHDLPPAVRELREGPASPADPATARDPAPKALTPAELQLRDSLVDHLRRANGNVAAVARQMRKGRTQIHRWIARYGIDLETVRRTKL